MTELFEELDVVGDPVDEENGVVHLLASLPELYDMLVTALETNSEVLKMEVVTECLLHNERKQKEKGSHESSWSKALYVSCPKKMLKCFHCVKAGHFRKNCRLLAT